MGERMSAIVLFILSIVVLIGAVFVYITKEDHDYKRILDKSQQYETDIESLNLKVLELGKILGVQHDQLKELDAKASKKPEPLPVEIKGVVKFQNAKPKLIEAKPKPKQKSK